jgi:hypothetical protein
VLSTILVGRRTWHGWLLAGANSVIICVIGFRTSQTGFIPANLFCIALYAYNVIKWRAEDAVSENKAPSRTEAISAPQSRINKVLLTHD